MVVKVETVSASVPAPSRRESLAPAPSSAPSREVFSAPVPYSAPAPSASRELPSDNVPPPFPAPIEDGGDTQNYLLHTAPRLSRMERSLMAHNEAPSKPEELSSTVDGGGRQLRAVRRAAPAEPVAKRAKKAQMVDKQSQTDWTPFF